MLDSLKIKNFRALEDFEVSKLGRVNLIVGKNNSGKSSVLEALRIYARNASPDILDLIAISHDEKALLKEGRETAIETEIPFQHFFTGRHLPIDEEKIIEIGSNSKSDSRLKIKYVYLMESEEVIFDEIGKKRIVIHRQPISKSEINHSNGQIILAISVSKGDIKYPPILLNDPRSGNRGILSLVDLTPCNIIPTQFISINELANDWDNIALTENETTVKEAMRIISPEFEDLNFVRNETNDAHSFSRVGKVKLANELKPIPLNSLGDGVLRVLQLMLKLFSARGGFLLIDEFENGLHYSVQEKVWTLLFEMAQKLDIQIFATTHSWDCIESFSKVATSCENGEGVLFRMGRSSKTSNFGQVVATVFDSAELETITQSDMEIR